MRKYFVIILSVLAFSVHAQQGFVRGKIIDTETGEGLFGATVSKQGTTTGTIADFDGNYSLSLDEGTHNIVVQFVSYQTQIIENVEVVADEVTTINLNLGVEVAQLEEVVVSAEIIRDNEFALLTMQRKSANVLDGVSSQTFKKTGDSNLSSAMKRVTGVSVQGGRYVYVRGLGDRYTKTLLNSMNIPGLDPERNDVQIDLFPTSVLENVIVHKTFSPDLPGDFSGGVVDVETKGFPEEKITRVSVGFGYNPDMHFNDQYVTYDGAGTDFLGFDNGKRAIPFTFDEDTRIPNVSINNPDDRQAIEDLTRSFNPQMAAENKRSFMNTSFSLNHGNQVDRNGKTIGYGMILNYQNNTEYYQNAEFGFYEYATEADDNDLNRLLVRAGRLGTNNVLWSALLSGAIKTDRNEFSTSIFHTQNGISQTSDRTTTDTEETGQTQFDDILTYTQRSVTNHIVSGKHAIKDDWKLEWTNSFTFSRVYDPDFRVTSIAEDEEFSGGEVVRATYSIAAGDGGQVSRFYRDLKEFNENIRADLTIPYGQKNKLKVGASSLLKWRDFQVQNFLFRTTLNDIENDPDFLLRDENIWTPETESGTYVTGNFEIINNYEGRSAVHAGYAMTDMFITEQFRAIFGARLEAATMHYTGVDFRRNEFDDIKTLDELNVLPSVNLVYSITENLNLRTSYGRTLARPSFREKSFANVLDPVSGLAFSGNIDLEQTSINNYDLRLENFFGGGEMISVSGFYKDFQGHIELTRFENVPNEYKPRNIGSSKVYGVEVELRKNLDMVFEGFSVGTNVSYAQSEVDMTEIITDDVTGKTEFDSRVEQARTGQTISRTRDMAGQAPFLVNAYLNYTDSEGLTNVNISYNVQGENLGVVGIGNIPDVYNRPFHSLNLNAFRNIGPEKKSRITIGVRNILDDDREQFFKGFDGVEENFSIFRPGQTYSVKYTYTF